MSALHHLKRWSKWLGVFFLGAASSSPSAAQERPGATAEEPQWLRYRLLNAYVGSEVEIERESRRLVGARDDTTRERLFLAPLLGISLDGSIYHPNLIYFRLDGEGGPSWEDAEVKLPNGGRSDQDEFGWLARGHGSFSILREKPYASRIFADRARIYRDYDFFNRVTVDRQSYGAQSGYTAGPVPISVSYTHVDEDIQGFLRDAQFDQDTVTFNAQNEREYGGSTRLSHTVDYFRGTEAGTISQDNYNHYLDASDVERLGPGEWITLNSRFYYNQLDSSLQDASSLVAQEVATFQLKENLQNIYEYSFDRRTTEDVQSNGHQGRASLRHQFYESLTSVFDIHAESSETTGPGSSSGFTRSGFGISETYTKRLGSWGRLTLGDSVHLDSEQRDAFGFVLAEPHTVSANAITFLNQPRVVRGTIVVRGMDVNGTFRTFTEGLHYTVQQIGLLTGIQRIPTAIFGIPEGGQVLVDYQASPQGSDAFDTVANQFHIRLDLWDNLLGLYNRVNTIDNYGGEQLLLQELTDVITGVDVTWKFARLGAEYEDYDSNLAPFRAKRLFQNFTFEPIDTMTLGVDFSESWTEYPDARRELTIYQIIGRYRWAITRALSYYAEGGVRFQQGEGFDQDLYTARTAFDYRYGKLSVQLGYEWQDEDFLGEMRERHFAFLRARRSF